MISFAVNSVPLKVSDEWNRTPFCSLQLQSFPLVAMLHSVANWGSSSPVNLLLPRGYSKAGRNWPEPLCPPLWGRVVCEVGGRKATTIRDATGCNTRVGVGVGLGAAVAVGVGAALGVNPGASVGVGVAVAAGALVGVAPIGIGVGVEVGVASAPQARINKVSNASIASVRTANRFGVDLKASIRSTFLCYKTLVKMIKYF